ncbi:MAG: pilus assembly protein, partial [Pseudomonadales bacterium]
MGNGVRCVKGSMTVEAMFLLPVVLGVLYAAAVYGITFFAKYQIQDVVDRAVASGLYVDRSAFAAADISAAVEARANDTLQGLKNNLPESWRGRLEGGCEPDVI